MGRGTFSRPQCRIADDRIAFFFGLGNRSREGEIVQYLINRGADAAVT